VNNIVCKNAVDGSVVTCTISKSDADYNYLAITETTCGPNFCSGQKVYDIELSNTKNAMVTAAQMKPFVLTLSSNTNNLIYTGEVANALPELAVGNITNINVLMDNTEIGAIPTYTFQFTTEAEIVQNGIILLEFTPGTERFSKDPAVTTTVCKITKPIQ
jgi:hypothetical protein